MDAITAQLTKQAVAKVEKTQISKNLNYTVEQSGFGQVLENQMNADQGANAQLSQMVGQLVGDQGSSMNAIAAPEIHVDLSQAGAELPLEVASKDSGGGLSSTLNSVFSEMNASQANMDGIIDQLASGQKFSTQEMMRLQLFAQQHTLGMEMASKVGEMGNNAIKTTFNTQI